MSKTKLNSTHVYVNVFLVSMSGFTFLRMYPSFIYTLYICVLSMHNSSFIICLLTFIQWNFFPDGYFCSWWITNANFASDVRRYLKIMIKSQYPEEYWKDKSKNITVNWYFVFINIYCYNGNYMKSINSELELKSYQQKRNRL